MQTDADAEVLARRAMPPPPPPPLPAPPRAPPPPVPPFHSDQGDKHKDEGKARQNHPASSLLRVRIATVEWSLAKPLPGIDAGASPLDGARLARVPVLRVWGPTPGGQRACVHVHKVRKGGREREREGEKEREREEDRLA